jgi:maltooligosyltrehalose trehalohydrolase
MGEEYGETVPFLYFTSFEDPNLAHAVREGRKRELGSHYSEREFADPQALSTFEKCKLDWSKTEIAPHVGILRLYRELISLRKQHHSLGNCRKDLTEIQFDESAKQLVLKRTDPAGSSALMVFNFSPESQSIQVTADSRPSRLLLWTGDAMYGGGAGPRPIAELAPDSKSRVLLAGFEAAVYGN